MTAPRKLRAGPLTMELDAGGLRHIRLGDREVLRYLYVAVRDVEWATIPLEISDLVVEETEDAFGVDFVADHQRSPIHYRWKGTLRGQSDGTIRFQMDGEVISTFKRSRIGICVLHPIEGCAGQPCRVERVDGTTVEGTMPRLISPNQPFFDIRAIAHEVEPGVRAEVRFEGEVFEMEDQRNWSDASYKTYSTPLALPRPVEVTAGTRLSQAVTLRLQQAAGRRPAAETDEVSFEVDPGRAFPLPSLGTALPARLEPLSPRERERIGALHLSHLRLDVTPSSDDFEATLDRGCAEARALGLPLELALHLSAAAGAELDRVAAALRKRRPAVSAYVVLTLGAETTSVEAARLARAKLTDPAAPLGGGTVRNFTEVNRHRAVVEGLDLVAFPNSPQVHLDDETTIAENLAPLSWIVETARSFAGTRPLALTPVTLKPRGQADPRQRWTFTAGWTAGHVGHAARAGFARATYYQAAGMVGMMDGDEVFPVFHALADVGELAGGEVLASRSSRPLEVEGVALRQGERLRLLLGNLGRAPRIVRLPPPFVSGLLRLVDESTAARAARDPEGFRREKGVEAGSTITLPPHAYATIDSRLK